MKFTSAYSDRTNELVELFRSTFAASEGEAEGDAIAKLVTDLLATADTEDIRVCLAVDNDIVIGCIMFTRLRYREDDRTVFMMAPVAVATAHHRKGIGQKLIGYGLGLMREEGVDVVVTYGDINYYAKTGFALISQTSARPPLPLQYPQGWLGQALSGGPMPVLVGPSTCVEAFNDPAYW